MVKANHALSNSAQVVETSVTVNNNSPIQDHVHPDDQTQPTFEMTPGFKPFTDDNDVVAVVDDDDNDDDDDDDGDDDDDDDGV